MSQPVGLYTVQVPPGGIMVPALPQGAVAMFRVSMAAIDPDAEPEYEDDAAAGKPPRSTLKIVRLPSDMDMDDEDDEDYEDEDSEDDSDDEEINGGPSDKAKAKQRQAAAALMDLDDDEDDDEDDTDRADFKAALSQLIKGKGPATGDDDEDDDDDEEGLELEETVVCTLDTEKQYQQPLDITIADDERVLFKVTGTHTVYLTGNFVMPAEEPHYHDDEDDEDDEDDYDYDLSPDEDELDGMDYLLNGGDESDDLDDLENPRIAEIDSEEEEETAPKLVTKGKNKRAAEEEAALDDLIAKDATSKSDKKQQKKLKKNNGDAAPVETKKEAKEAPAAKSDKKEVQGVKIDDKKLGKGPAAKNGNTVAMRYIGKLEDGKVFDSNKKGKPFTFKLGKGEVIKGWDIGIAGMTAGGERRITIPSHLAYGKKALPGIPANSKLIFDVKLLEIK
uniref:FK506-binding protein n=1 Tax=Talaromyces marneffei PM1 TaxID=1077442 RepID=A0A093VTH3_TALMA